MEIEGVDGSTEEEIEPETSKTKKIVHYKCKECPFATRWRSSLFRHRKLHEDKQLQCELCPSKFADGALLRDHVKVKHGEGLICTHCAKKFKSRSGLLYHVKKFRGEFQYKCEECGKLFIGKQHYEGHVNTHRNFKPYRCSRCRKGFVYTFMLNDHIKTCIDRDPESIRCNVCQMNFSTKQALYNHCRGKHTAAVRRCEVYGVSYKWDASYYRHMRVNHKK